MVRRHLKLRQIEAFKAIIESGTLVRASELLNISQPAMSKLVSHLEYDTGLRLFDRVKGRLAPTEQAMELYSEVDRIFAGVRQVENAVEAIRRAEQGRLTIGVMPGFAGSFIRQATTAFLSEHPNVFCSVQSLSSEWIIDWLVTRKLDVGLVEPGLDNPYLSFEPVMEEALVCIMPVGHALAEKSSINIEDLDQLPFIGLNPDSFLAHRIESMFDDGRVRPQITMVANLAQTMCEFVAAGVGVSLIHPLLASGYAGHLIMRPFRPEIRFGFQLCRNADGRNTTFVDAFTEKLRFVAANIAEQASVAMDQRP